MLIIGSFAIIENLPNERIPKDIDLICSREEFLDIVKYTRLNLEVEKLQIKDSGAMLKAKNYIPLEVTFLGEGQFAESNKLLISLCKETKSKAIPYSCNMISCISYDIYALMKETHKYRKNSPHFLKTMNDLLFYHTQFNIEYFKYKYKDFYDLRCKETYNYSHPNLNQNKDTFFTDSVGYIYDHDCIHEAVKHLDKPAYKYYIEDSCEVKCSKEKFDKLPEIVKLYGVLEEVYVLALERAIIPNKTEVNKAFDIALEKVCTSITSGWFREYAYNNYFKVKELYHDSFIDKFNSALMEGKIELFKE